MSLDAILFEVGKIDNTINAADRSAIAPADLSRIKRSSTVIFTEADRLMTWLSESRLEEPKN